MFIHIHMCNWLQSTVLLAEYIILGIYFYIQRMEAPLPPASPQPPAVSQENIAPTASPREIQISIEPVSPVSQGECSVSKAVPTADIQVSTPQSERLNFSFGTPWSPNVSIDSDYVPDTPVRRKLGEMPGGTTPFLTNVVQIQKLINNINATSQCRSKGCNGMLILKHVDLVGMGGEGQAYFSCSGGCDTRNVTLPCSNPYKDSKQTVLSVALQTAFICSGAMHSQYESVLGTLGMHPVSSETFFSTVLLLYDPVTRVQGTDNVN